MISALHPDKRSLDEIYEAAQKESGPLIVASGGDGTMHVMPYNEAQLNVYSSPGTMGCRALRFCQALS